jgi:1-phosphatidylinositol-3-phosphate 5-kinase
MRVTLQHRLIVGIIDYIRQYTWDKHVETWVKSSGILPGTSKQEPTVISPKQYMKRFRAAMETYFTVVPFASRLPEEIKPKEKLMQY